MIIWAYDTKYVICVRMFKELIFDTYTFCVYHEITYIMCGAYDVFTCSCLGAQQPSAFSGILLGIMSSAAAQAASAVGEVIEEPDFSHHYHPVMPSY